jgi:DNA-binding CsgD family transcriptional regulator
MRSAPCLSGRTAISLRLHRAQPRAKTGWDSLTDAELKVVALIAQGVANRDVATRLHLSLHTVKTHVRSAFAKLGINSRSQLTRFMRASD